MPRVGRGGPPGVRLNPRQDARCRAAIKTSALIHRLSDFVLGIPDRRTNRPIEMSDGQIRAALGLLRKTLPDLAVLQLEGGDEPMRIEFSWADSTPVIDQSAAVALPEIAADDDECVVTWAGETAA